MSTTKQYELVYIAAPEATEEQLAALHGEVEQVVGRFQGTIDKTETWGRRRLAYQIGRYKEGIYVLHVISGSGELVKELDRRLKVTDNIVRHLVVRVDEELKIAEHRKQRRQAKTAKRRVARGLPAEPTPEEKMRHVAARGGDGPDDRLDEAEI
jgi:small subunit ribosomal protein S6